MSQTYKDVNSCVPSDEYDMVDPTRSLKQELELLKQEQQSLKQELQLHKEEIQRLQRSDTEVSIAEICRVPED